MNKESGNTNFTINISNEIAEKYFHLIVSLLERLNRTESDNHDSKSKEFLQKSDIVKESLLENQLKEKIEEQNLNQPPSLDNEIIKLSKELKEKATTDTGAALVKLKDSIRYNCSIYDEVILLLNRMNRIIKGGNGGLLDPQFAYGEENKIVHAFLYLVNNLDNDSLLENESSTR